MEARFKQQKRDIEHPSSSLSVRLQHLYLDNKVPIGQADKSRPLYYLSPAQEVESIFKNDSFACTPAQHSHDYDLNR